jgi:DNA polymerase III subunit gamma/tau
LQRLRRHYWGLTPERVAIVAAMATQSLYRRYRPRRFSEVKGQDHVVRALRNAVAEGREGQAYLFSGPRGTGKTTSARILAKVLNCENPQDGEPCCECESCLAVERGVSYDVHELDAASNNGVDAMRDLIEKASLGTPGRHKVYILDEVHMLSRAAEAALLKTLEEPPPHVVFVLATTDPQKMSDTIRSRTQHLQFHLLPADTLAEHVRWVAADAGLDVSEAALEQALSRGGGSARDTLSALELVASTGDEGMEVLQLDEFVEAMVDRDAGRGLTVVAHAISGGTDPRTLTEELIAFLRNGFLALMAPELVQVPSNRLDALAAQAQRLGAGGLVRGIELLGGALAEMRHAPDPRVLLDVATVQLTSEEVGGDVVALLQRIERLERQVAAGGVVSPAEPKAPAPVDPSTGRAALGGRARATPTVTPASDRSDDIPPAAVPAAGAGRGACGCRGAGGRRRGRSGGGHHLGGCVGEHHSSGAAGNGARGVRACRLRSQHLRDAHVVGAERRTSGQVRGTTPGRRSRTRCVRRQSGRRGTPRRWRRRRCSGWRDGGRCASDRRIGGFGHVDCAAAHRRRGCRPFRALVAESPRSRCGCGDRRLTRVVARDAPGLRGRAPR